jgi:hypothetical protein
MLMGLLCGVWLWLRLCLCLWWLVLPLWQLLTQGIAVGRMRAEHPPTLLQLQIRLIATVGPAP